MWDVVPFGSKLVGAAVVVTFAGLGTGCRDVNAEPKKTEAKAAPPAPAPSPPAAATSAAPAVVDAPAAPRNALEGRRFVLHVGDSTVGYTLGMSLEMTRLFRAASVPYESHTFTASGLHAFASERRLEKLVKEKNPDLVIIQLGTNNLTVPNPPAYLDDVKSIVSQAAGRACYWIGPIPLEQPEKGMRGFLRDNVGPCTFYDSFDLKLERQSDHIHPTQSAAKKWAKAFWAFTEATPPGDVPAQP